MHGERISFLRISKRLDGLIDFRMLVRIFMHSAAGQSWLGNRLGEKNDLNSFVDLQDMSYLCSISKGEYPEPYHS